MLVAVGAPGAAAPDARSAKRPATATERAELAAAVGLAPECIDAAISTVDPEWAFFSATNIASCPMADGFVVLRREVSGWQLQHQGNGIEACPVGQIPTPVARDLGLCRAPRTYIMCWPGGRDPERSCAATLPVATAWAPATGSRRRSISSNSGGAGGGGRSHEREA